MSGGLRERARVRRRATIEECALRLFAQHGYEAITLVQVAAESEVSTRTLQQYFPSKLDLALAYSADASERLRQACVNRLPGESVLLVLQRWLTTEATEHRDRIARHGAMLAANPGLRGSETSAITAARQAVTEEFASDLGKQPDDPVVALASGALVGLISAALDIGTAGDVEVSARCAAGYASAIINQALNAIDAEKG